MGAYEEQLKKIVNGPRWNADALLEVKRALEDMIDTFKAAQYEPGWKGASADAAVENFNLVLTEARKNSDVIDELVIRIHRANNAIDEAGRTLGELPDGSIDPTVKAAVVGGASVVLPGFGTIASVGALALAENFMAGGRDKAAKAALENLGDTTSSLAGEIEKYRSEFKISDRGREKNRERAIIDDFYTPNDPGSDPGSGGPTGPGVTPGGGNPTGPGVSPVGIGLGVSEPPVLFIDPARPESPGTGDGSGDPDVGGPGITTPGGHGRPSVDGGLGDGVIGGGGTGGSIGGHVSGSGSAGGSAGGGGSLGGAGLLGAAGGGAAGLAGAKAAGAAARAGASFGGAGSGVLGGAGGAGPAAAGGTSTTGGANAAGARSGTGMMGGGGAGAGSEEEKERRGLGLFAPKLEDDETPEVPRAAGAGSRKPQG